MAVVGRLRLNEWTTANGDRRSRIQVVADAVDFVDKPKATKPAADDADQPAEQEAADRPALGTYRRRKAS